MTIFVIAYLIIAGLVTLGAGAVFIMFAIDPDLWGEDETRGAARVVLCAPVWPVLLVAFTAWAITWARTPTQRD